MKALAFTDIEITDIEGSLIEGRAANFIFYWNLPGKGIESVKNPSPAWLTEFVSQDKPYELNDVRAWTTAWYIAVAKEAQPKIMEAFAHRSVLTKSDIADIIADVVKQYDPTMAKSACFMVDNYLQHMDIPAEEALVLNGTIVRRNEK